MQYCRNISNSITTIKEAINHSEIQINQLNREQCKEYNAVMVKFIQGMLHFYGYDESSMTDYQVIEVIKNITEKYYYFRMADVCLCFKRARQSQGIYGKFYGKVDGSTILNWFAVYDKERDEVIQSIGQPIAKVQQDSGISYQDYIDELLVKLECGDMFATEMLQNAYERMKRFNKWKIDFGNYKYQRKHKYDNDILHQQAKTKRLQR